VPEPGAGGWSVIARLGKTRGLKGEIYGDGSWPAARYAELKQVWLRPAGQQAGAATIGPLKLVSATAYKGRLIFRFEGVDSIEAAGAFERLEVVIPNEDRPHLAEGEFYLADLVGCQAVHRRTGQKLGVVTGWQDCGGPVLLELAPEGGRQGDALLIPFARGICVEIDPAAGRIVIDPPDGLLELNGPETGA